MNISMLAFTVGIVVALASCSGSKNSTAQHDEAQKPSANAAHDAAFEKLNPELVINKNSEGYYLGLVVGAGGDPNSDRMRTLRSVDSVTFRIYSKQGKLIESQTTNRIDQGGVMNSQDGAASITVTAGITWSPTTVEPGTYAVMTVFTQHGEVVRRRDIIMEEQKSGKILQLSLDGRSFGTGMEFTLRVERLQPTPSDEYLPSGEQYRIEIEDGVGMTVWSSSQGKMFTQSIGQVEPTEVGQTVEHQEYWDGSTYPTGTRLKPGRYTIVGIIPAKPKPYMIREELTWSGQ